MGPATPQPLRRTVTHPLSPTSGSFWMESSISFKRIRIYHISAQNTSAESHDLYRVSTIDLSLHYMYPPERLIVTVFYVAILLCEQLP